MDAPPPPGTFVDPGAYDPLRSTCTDLFWYNVEPSFRPFVEDDVRALRALAVPHERALPADEPRVPVASDNNDDVADDPMARMRSFPISHRLVAALLDEGKGAASAARALRSAPAPEPAWLPSALPALRSFNLIFEARVKAELLDAGVLLPEDDDSLAECMRLEQWHLRNLTAANAESKGKICTKLAAELKTQATRREKKRKHDQIEVEYIKKMMETGGKRGKSRFSKLLHQMHPNRDLPIGAAMQASHTGANGDTNSHDRKKKKRKSHHDRHKSKHAHNSNDGPNKQTGSHDSLSSGGGGDIAPIVADIIWKHKNRATMSQIVAEFVKMGRHLGQTETETRNKIEKVLSFSRKPYRFPKNTDKTFSVLQVT